MSEQVGTGGIERLKRHQTRAAVAGAAGLVALVAGGVGDPEQFFQSYLPAFIFVFGIALGSLALLMLQHMTGGAWGMMIRRIVEAGSRTLPLVAVLFLPMLFGLPHLYIWAVPEVVAADPILQDKAPYLNVGFFAARAAFFFAIWLAFAYFLLVSLTIVYTADHYVVDVIGGMAFALAAHAAMRWLVRRREARQAVTSP